jgi:hypothetical protein
VARRSIAAAVSGVSSASPEWQWWLLYQSKN